MAQEATISATKATVVPGSTGDAVVSFSVPVAIGGWQMEVELPDGITLESKADGSLEVGGTSATATVYDKSVILSDLHKNHQVIGGNTTAGDVLLVCVPKGKEEAITATSGQLCTLKFTAANTFTGKQTVKIKNFVASDPKGEKTYTAADITFEISDNLLMGDANGDGVIDVADVVEIVNFILEKPSAKFNEAAADVNDDKVIDAADVVAVVNIILKGGNVNAARIRAFLEANGFIF